MTRDILLYGSFTVPDTLNKDNFVIIRIPVKGVRWVVLMQAAQRLVKRITNTPRHKSAPYWNVDGDTEGAKWKPERHIYAFNAETKEFERIREAIA